MLVNRLYEAYPRDANGQPIHLLPDRPPFGGQVVSADTNIHRLGYLTGTNATTTRTCVKDPKRIKVESISKANPGVLTCYDHGLVSTDVIRLPADLPGMVELKNAELTVTRVDADTVTIGVDTSGYTAWTTGTPAYAQLVTGHFTLTGIDTSNGENCFANWFIEITQDGYNNQTVQIASNTGANPGVAAIKAQDYVDSWLPLPVPGNLTFAIYPVCLFPIIVTLDTGASGELTLYAHNGTSAYNIIEVLEAADNYESWPIPVRSPKDIYYAFSAHGAGQEFRWRESL